VCLLCVGVQSKELLKVYVDQKKDLVLRSKLVAFAIEALAIGLEHLHNSVYATHRDIKPENLLLRRSPFDEHFSSADILIADLGYASSASPCLDPSAWAERALALSRSHSLACLSSVTPSCSHLSLPLLSLSTVRDVNEHESAHDLPGTQPYIAPDVLKLRLDRRDRVKGVLAKAAAAFRQDVQLEVAARDANILVRDHEKHVVRTSTPSHPPPRQPSSLCT
jgi:serine/threonine protein kinase